MGLKIVVPAYGGTYESVVDELVAAEYEVRRLPTNASSWTNELIDTYFADADAFLGTFGSLTITREVLRRAKSLRIGVSPIIGTEFIDVQAATDYGILIANGAAPANFDSVAEAVVMLVAVMVKRLPAKWATVRSGGWRTIGVGRLMSEITLGMIGFGNVGRATAERINGFGTRLLAYDPFVEPAVAARHGVELVSLETLLASSDVVAVMTPLNDETRHLIGEKELRAMRVGSYLINVSPGACVDEVALISALRAGYLAGAALDSFEVEPPAENNPLRTMPQVIVTGHNVGHSQVGYETLSRLALEQLEAGLSGEVPQHVVNPEALARWHQRVARLVAEE